MNHALLGLATNTALPPALLDRLITVAVAVADDETADALATRTDLSHAQAVTLAGARAGARLAGQASGAPRGEQAAVRLAYRGLLTAADINPVTQPYAALALLDEGAGRPDWARLFAADPDTERRQKLAACPALPPDVTETLAADPDVRVVTELALWTTPAVAARLAHHPHAEVRRAVATNEATPPAVLAALITGVGPASVRCCQVRDERREPPREHATWLAAAGNPATPSEAVVGFANHDSDLLRWALASRPDLPAEVYERLAADPVPGVRAALARNPAIGEALIRKLAADPGPGLDPDPDPDPGVRRALAHNPRVPLDVLSDLAATTKIGPILLPRIAAASPDEVEELAGSANPAVRMLLAERRDLPARVRDALAVDPDAKVVKSIAPHPGISEARLRTMIDRHGAQVRARVAANPDASPQLLLDLTLCQPSVRKALCEIAAHPNAPAQALLACLADERARPIAACHPALPEPVVVALLADGDWQVVEAAAGNPSLPVAVMAELVAGLGSGVEP